MKHRFLVCILTPIAMLAADEMPPKFAAEFRTRWENTRKLSVGVAEVMPQEQYAFRPDPPSMNFGELMAHIAWGNYAFCYALKDSAGPATSTATDKAALIKVLADSFDYCTATISALTDKQLDATHSTPDGRMSGREALLAMYVHLAHHRGQAEIYLRIKGIKPPSYAF